MALPGSGRSPASLACGLALLACAAAAAGQDGPPVVRMLFSREQAIDSGAVMEAVRAQLSDLEVRLEAREVEGLSGSALARQISAAERETTAGVLAAFWFDFGAEGSVHLFLAGPGGERVLVRRLEASQATGRAEGLAIIVRASVAAMLQGGRIGISVEEAVAMEDRPREPAPPPPPPGAPPPAADDDDDEPSLSMGVAYSYHARSDDQPAISGLWLGLELRVAGRLSVLAGYTVLANVEAGNDLATLKLAGHPVDFGLGARFPAGPLELGGALSMVVDNETQEAERLAAGMRRNGDTDDLIIGLRAMADLSARIAPRLRLFLCAGVQVPLNPRRYSASGPDGSETLIDSWPVYPWALLGLRVGLL